MTLLRNRTVADAIFDRLHRGLHHIELQDKSMRKQRIKYKDEEI